MSLVVVWQLLLLVACLLVGAQVLNRVPALLTRPPVATGLLGVIGTGLAVTGTVSARRASAGEWPALHHVQIPYTTTELLILCFACLTAAGAVELVPSSNRWAQLALRSLFLLTCVLNLAQGPASPPQISLLMALIVWPLLMIRALWEGALRGLGHPSGRVALRSGLGLLLVAVCLAVAGRLLLRHVTEASGTRGLYFLVLAALPGVVVLLLTLATLFVGVERWRPGSPGAAAVLLLRRHGKAERDGDSGEDETSEAPAAGSRSVADSVIRAVLVLVVGLVGLWTCDMHDDPGPALALVLVLVMMAVLLRDAGIAVGTLGVLVAVAVAGQHAALERLTTWSAPSTSSPEYWQMNRQALADGGPLGQGVQAWWLGTAYGEPRTRLDSGFLGMIAVRGGWVALLGLALLVLVLVVSLWRAGAVAPGADGGAGPVLSRTAAVAVAVFGLGGVLAVYGLAPWIGWPAPLGLTRLSEATWLIGTVAAVGILLETDGDDDEDYGATHAGHANGAHRARAAHGSHE